MASLHVEGVDRPLPLERGQSLLDAIMNGAVPIATACGGVAACGLCRLQVLEGMPLLRALASRETAHLGNLLVERGWRLACQARLVSEGEVRVVVPQVDDIARRKQEKLTRQLREQRARRQLANTVSDRGQGKRRR